MCEVTFMLAQVRLRLECCPSPSAVHSFSDVYGADQQREWSATRKLTDPPPIFLALDADRPPPVQKQDDVDRDPHDGHGHVHAHHARECSRGRARRFAKLATEDIRSGDKPSDIKRFRTTHGKSPGSFCCMR